MFGVNNYISRIGNGQSPMAGPSMQDKRNQETFEAKANKLSKAAGHGLDMVASPNQSSHSQKLSGHNFAKAAGGGGKVSSDDYLKGLEEEAANYNKGRNQNRLGNV